MSRETAGICTPPDGRRLLVPAPDGDEEAFQIIEDEDVRGMPDAVGGIQGLVARMKAWRVLVVDDDPDVHAATSFAVKGFEFNGRGFELLHAHTAQQALAILRREQDIAVALIDVVMEDPDAGLKLVEAIREAGFLEMRLILRTGQPGYAPEMKVIADYDINDYRTKSELTRSRLLSVLATAVRSYSQIRLINESRLGLEMIVDSSANLFSGKNMQLLSRGVLTQLASIMAVPASGLVCIGPLRTGGAPRTDDFTVVSDAGRFVNTIGRPLSAVDDDQVATLFAKIVGADLKLLIDGPTALYFHGGNARQVFVYLETVQSVSAEILTLLKVFANNIAICLENVELIERLDSLAFIDPVLDVPNYNAFEATLQTMERRSHPNLRLVLLAIDELDAIVGAYGLALTQASLKAVYDRLRADSPDAYLIARVSDGAFGILADIDDRLPDIAARVLSDPVVVDGIALALTATTVIVDIDDGNCDAHTLLRNASAALVTARSEGTGAVQFSSRTVGDGVRRRLLLQSALRRALQSHCAIDIALQPKVDTVERRIIGAEALARWSHDGQPVSPAEFIPIAESSGLSDRITEQVLDGVGQWAAERRHSGLPPLPVAVNLAMRDMHQPGFADRLLRRIAMAGLSEATVTFEITENSIMRRPDSVLAELIVLREAGFRIAVDDFGTGYSSLGYLERLPVDALKIDRIFVDHLTRGNARRSIAATTVAMAESLGIDVIAEGVETHEQHEALSMIRCRYRQGFLYGRPVPIASFHGAFADWSQIAAVRTIESGLPA
ncbi:MAG: EAL domain-containing protein [Rhodospirillaceae bacterium]|nr:EAL domain-containing protein [Rhodospirillaceae bacterium]